MRKLCEQNGSQCKTCIGSNCNSKLQFNRCLVCSTNIDHQCAIDPNSARSDICKNYNDECFTYIEKFGISRGCVSEPNYPYWECENDPDKCAMCITTDEKECNDQKIIMETCVECDSNKSESCQNDPLDYKDKVCSGLTTTKQEGCYLRVVSFLEY